LAGQDVGHLFELEVVVGVERQRLVLVLDARVGALEVEPRSHLLVRLVERITNFHVVHFRNDIERWHWNFSSLPGTLARAPAWRKCTSEAHGGGASLLPTRMSRACHNAHQHHSDGVRLLATRPEFGMFNASDSLEGRYQ